MAKESLKLKQKRARLIEEMKDIYKRAEEHANDDGKWSNDYDEQWTRADNEIINLDKKIERVEKLERANAIEAVERSEEIKNEPKTVEVTPEQRAENYKKAYSTYLRTSPVNLDSETRLMLESRGTATQVVGTPSLGGYLVPESWSTELIAYMKAFGGMLDVSRIISTERGETMTFPYVDVTSQVGQIIGEGNSEVVQDVAFNEKTLGAFMYTSDIIKVSYELLQDNQYNLEGYLQEVMGQRLGRKINVDLTNGAGTTEPFGVVTQAADSGVTASAASRDTILDLIHSVDPAYRGQGKLMFNDATLAAIRKLAVGTSDDRPLWQPSMIEGEPNRIEGFEYVINQDMPDIGALASNKWALFGDFSQYYVRMVSGITMESSWEAYFGDRVVGYHAFTRMDGGLIGNTAAIKYVAGA